MKPRFFRSAAEMRRWLEKHSDSAQELWLGYHKRASGKPSVTWPESVDHALCFGWIDGLRKNIDATRYMIRFTPRKPSSTWSAVNIKRVEILRGQRLMRPAGLKAFSARRENRSGIYSYEQRPEVLPAPYAARLKKRPQAFAFFAAQPPSYRRAAIWWVVSAKQEATRLRRLEQLIEDSAHARRLKQFTARAPQRG
jgi:uncharacterized protein YdeI (YjbR/CyaY-like superfamily)